MPKVLGFDVCRGKIVCCLLDKRPQKVSKYYLENNKYYHIENNQSGVELLKVLSPDFAVGEPTGIKYLKFWEKWLAKIGCEVSLIPNQALPSYRQFLGLPDKDDEADALALACYWFDYSDNPRKFVSRKDSDINVLRELIFRRIFHEESATKYINVVHQDLGYEFPEVSTVKSPRRILKSPAVFWRWLADPEIELSRYDDLYADSCGFGLSVFTEFNADIVCRLGEHCKIIEQQIDRILLKNKFTEYIEVFEEFGFGLPHQAILLSQLYPLERFYGPDGKPEVIYSVGKNSGKLTKKPLSLRRVRKILGVAPTRDWSGGKRRHKKGGSDLCRLSLWQWSFVRIEPERSRLKNEVGDYLHGIYLSEKQSGKPIAKVRRKVWAKAVEIMFNKLVDALR
ncbi:IS110 family transposase [Okeania sp. SIO2B3]|uniref:IS110 family transposase n=1 Tax=Okeania sp. SIO2B3 TaxID=2607784 RepID=UPI0013C16219|nr:IS110 family transposase [Okeania sp. SIO2B3]NET40605.1 IS110 family transposase [Okeania sp. SIO2B3]